MVSSKVRLPFKACHDIDKWPLPVPGDIMSLPILGHLIEVCLPIKIDKYSLPVIYKKDLVSVLLLQTPKIEFFSSLQIPLFHFRSRRCQFACLQFTKSTCTSRRRFLTFLFLKSIEIKILLLDVSSRYWFISSWSGSWFCSTRWVNRRFSSFLDQVL